MKITHIFTSFSILEIFVSYIHLEWNFIERFNKGKVLLICVYHVCSKQVML